MRPEAVARIVGALEAAGYVVDATGWALSTARKSITYVQYERDWCHTCDKADVKLP